MTATDSKAGPSALFLAAFRQSKNAMLLVDADRTILDVNGAYLKLLGHKREAVVGHPLYEHRVGGALRSPEEWKAQLAGGQFTGETDLYCADGSRVRVQWAATTEVVTGRQLVLFVALATSTWGVRFRRVENLEPKLGALSDRELEVVRLVAFGSTGPEIAEELQISHHTVRTHVRNAMAKVDARSRAHLVAKTLGEGHFLS
jgi:PAS domain S-box-containing protein